MANGALSSRSLEQAILSIASAVTQIIASQDVNQQSSSVTSTGTSTTVVNNAPVFAVNVSVNSPDLGTTTASISSNRYVYYSM